MKKQKETKEEIAKQPVVKAVAAKRALNGKRLVPSGEKQRLLREKAEKSRKEAEEAIMEEESKGGTPKKQISFSKGGGPTKASTPMKSALRKGKKETIKNYKHELVVMVRAKVTYERKKNQVRKKTNEALSAALMLMRDTLLEGKSDIVFLGK